MVDNLIETGTPFDYKGVDFTKLRDKYEQFEADLADDNEVDCTTGIDLNDVEDNSIGGLRSGTNDAATPMPGDRDIPVRDMRYVDQRQERFDNAPMHIPTFEDED